MKLREYLGLAKRETVEEITFEPFTFCVEVTSPEDLAYLWALFNMSAETLVPAVHKAATERPKAKGPFRKSFYDKISRDPAGKRAIWELLNEHLVESGILLRDPA